MTRAAAETCLFDTRLLRNILIEEVKVRLASFGAFLLVQTLFHLATTVPVRAFTTTVHIRAEITRTLVHEHIGRVKERVTVIYADGFHFPE